MNLGKASYYRDMASIYKALQAIYTTLDDIEGAIKATEQRASDAFDKLQDANPELNVPSRDIDQINSIFASLSETREWLDKVEEQIPDEILNEVGL